MTYFSCERHRLSPALLHLAAVQYKGPIPLLITAEC